MNKLVITTQRLMIRNLEPRDLNLFHQYRSNPDITKYQGFDVMDIPGCAQFIEQHQHKVFGIPGEWVQYGIENMDKGDLIGDCAIRVEHDQPKTAEIGITISPIYHRKGFAKEAMLGIITFLFDVKDMHRIVETVDAENTASIRLLESTGFRKEGSFIENIFFKGKWGSEFQYAMLNREWVEIKNSIRK